MSSGLLDFNPRLQRESKPASHRAPERLFDLLAIDLDGTLIRSDKRMNLQDVAAIKLASAAGVKVVLASARPPRTVREIYDLLGLDTPQINYNGALVRDPLSEINLLHRPLPGHRVREIVRVARRVLPEVLVSLEVLDQWYTDHHEPTLGTATSRSFPPDYVGSLEPLYAEPVTKLMLLANPDRLVAVREAILEEFGTDIALMVSDRHLLQIAHPSVSKSLALAWVAGMLDIQPDRVVAIGDAPNDICMLQWAGLGLAVDNAWPETMAAADAIVPANNDAGVAHAIYRHVLAN